MPDENNRIYIVGAGFAGSGIAAEIAQKQVLGRVVAFLDDDPAKIGTRIHGTPVLGPIEDVVSLLDHTPGDEAIIAIPSADKDQLRRMYAILKGGRFSRIRILPGLSHIVEGDAHLIQTKEIDPEDLLGRTPVHIHLKESLRYLRGKRVLVTGAGGSIGSEIARQLLSAGVARLYLFGHGENSIYEIDRELRILQEEGVGEKTSIVPIVGELQDQSFCSFIVKRLKADAIFHCAAFKHVPMMEANPVAAIQNNVFGTWNLARAAETIHPSRFVLISTDKAVEPGNIYGASKYIAEKIVLSRSESLSQFMVVRFGNVLGSRGSVVPLFRRQIAKGGPVTVTSPDTTRFFMTNAEAASLVLKTGGVGNHGGLYLLDMGSPVRIADLAAQMIRFYGFEPEHTMKIELVGLRRGEKLHESLSAGNETVKPTEHEGIHYIEGPGTTSDEIEALLGDLRPICFDAGDGAYRNRKALRRRLRRFVPSLNEWEDEPEF